MPNLYDLAKDFAFLREAVDADDLTDDELTALLDQLDESKLDLKTKVDNICRVIANMGAAKAAFDREEKRLAARRKTLENKEKHLRNWVQITMEMMQVPKIVTDLHTVTITKNPPKVIVTDIKLVPPEFLHPPKDPEVDKKAVLSAFKESGEYVPGTAIVEGAGLKIR